MSGKRPWLCGLIVFLIPLSPAQATPDKSTQWFMDEPVSLFDKGMYLMARQSEQQAGTFRRDLNAEIGESFITRVGSSIDYLWDEDRINIVWHIYYDAAVRLPVKNYMKRVDSKRMLRNLCTAFLEHLEGAMYGQSDTWNINAQYRLNDLFNHFGHSDYENASTPKDVYKRLAEKIRYNVRLQSNQYLDYLGSKELHRQDLPVYTPLTCRTSFTQPLTKVTPTFEGGERYDKDQQGAIQKGR